MVACSHYVFTSFPYENLGERGFELNQSLTIEEHGVVTQTLVVPSPQGASVRLEFKDIVDEEDFLAHSRQENPSVRGREVLRPSLRFFGASSFKKVVGSIPVTVAAEDKSPLVNVSHSNSVQTFWGVYLGLSPKDQLEWNDFLGVNAENGEWVLADGIRLIAGQPGDGLYEFMEVRKDFPLWAVILKSESFEIFTHKADPERILNWKHRPTALIKEHLTDWDLLVI